MKRQNWEIKDEILEGLEKYPQNLSQLSKRLNTSMSTVEKHLKDLESYGKVRESREWVNGNEKTVWRKNKV